MQGRYGRDFQHVTACEQQAEFAAEANHSAAEPRREQLGRDFAIGNARPCQHPVSPKNATARMPAAGKSVA
jgi:hypothetical protein